MFRLLETKLLRKTLKVRRTDCFFDFVAINLGGGPFLDQTSHVQPVGTSPEKAATAWSGQASLHHKIWCTDSSITAS